MRSLRSLPVVLLVAAVLPHLAAAQGPFAPLVDLSGASFTLPVGGGDAVRGFSFDVSQPVTITHLGWLDAGPAGLAMAHEVGIFDGGGALIASGTVPAGTAAPLVAGFRYVSIPPVLLAPGQTYVVAGTDPNPGGDVFAFQASGVGFDPRLVYGQSRWVSSSTLVLPTNHSASDDQGFFGPNLGAHPAAFGPAVDLSGATSLGAVGGGDAVRGFAFTVKRRVQVGQLGWFDDGPAGLAQAHEVAIFDGSGSIVASATVPAGTLAPVIDGFRYVTIPTVTLAPGQTYVVAGTDPNPGGDQFRFQASGVGTDPRLSFVESRWVSSSTLTLPVNHSASDDDGFFGPNFTLATTEVPALPAPLLGVLALLLAAVSLAQLGRGAKRRL